jgi:hypothetical protein
MKTSNDVFITLAGRVAESCPEANTGQIADILKQMRDRTIGYSEQCKEKVIRNLFSRAGKNLNGVSAEIVRWKIDDLLPDQFKSKDIKNALIVVGAYAADNEDVWRMIYPNK